MTTTFLLLKGPIMKNNYNKFFFNIIPDLTGFLQGDEDHFHLRVFQRHRKKTGLNIPERL